MERDEYDAKEAIFQAGQAERHKAIEEKYARLRHEHEEKLAIEKAQTQQNLRDKQKNVGGTAKEDRDVEDVDKIKHQQYEHLMGRDRSDSMQKADDELELEIFGKKWARLEAREPLFGPNDHIVASLKKQKEAEDRQKEADRERFRPDFGRPHKMDQEKGKPTQSFNRGVDFER